MNCSAARIEPRFGAETERATNSLIAYSAANLGTQPHSASLGSSNTFTPVTVANGLVYAATAGALGIFGLGAPAKTQPIANGTYTMPCAFRRAGVAATAATPVAPPRVG